LQAPGVKLGSGGIQLNENTTIAVVSAASTNTVYAGTYTGLGGNFDLNGNTLTLSGVFNSTNDNLVTSTATSAIGTLVVSGTGALSGLTIDSGNLLDVSGSITQAGSIQIGEASGVVPASNADMTIAKGGFDTLAANASIIGNGTLTVQGTLNSSAATGSVTINSGVLVDNGTIAAQLSTLNVLSAISGAGSFSINASNGSTLDLGNLSTIGTVTTISFVGTVGTGGELVVNNTSGFDATLANFGAGDFIDLSGFAGVLTFTAGAHANQIDVRDSGDNSIVLNFATSQTSNLGSFFSTTDGNNVLVVGFK